MKLFMFLLSLFCFFNINGQSLNKLDFSVIVFDTKEIIKNLKSANTKEALTLLNISDFKTKNTLNNTLNKMLTERIHDIHNSLKNKTYFFPSYKLTKIENQFELTIEVFKIVEDKNKSEQERSVFYFVIKSTVLYDKDKMQSKFSNSKILFNENEINKWWLSQWKKYVSETGKIYKLYNYLPPPPSPAPLNVK